MATVLVALGLLGMFMSAHQVTATTPPPAGPSVTILGPLPLPVTGTVAVSGLPSSPLTVQGTVGATQNGTWSVLAKNVDQPTPFRLQLGFGAAYTVPSGKVFIIESITAFASCTGGGTSPATKDLTLGLGPVTVPLDFQGPANGSFWAYTNPQGLLAGLNRRIVVEPGEVLQVLSEGNSGSGGDSCAQGTNVFLSGSLANAS
jgi:hypothetical protein